MFNDFGTISVVVNIPSEKIYAQTQMVVDEYKDIVAEGLEEAKAEVLQDTAFKSKIKNAVKEKLYDCVQKSMERAIADVADRIMSLRFDEFRELAGEVLNEKGYFEVRQKNEKN
jgi:hypothetical protein